jgi:hypothetical protein
MSEAVVGTTILSGVIIAVVWSAWHVSTNKRRERLAGSRAEMQARLLDRIGSSADVIAFLKTEGGRRLVESTISEPVRQPYARILGSVQAGIVLLVVGIAMLALAKISAATSTEFVVIGTLALAFGVGFLLSSWVAYTLSKSWGLFDQERTEPVRDESP